MDSKKEAHKKQKQTHKYGEMMVARGKAGGDRQNGAREVGDIGFQLWNQQVTGSKVTAEGLGSMVLTWGCMVTDGSHTREHSLSTG